MSEKQPDVRHTKLEAGIDKLGLNLNQEIRNQLLGYLSLLEKWNKTYNLTAIRDPQQMVVRHVLDALSIIPYLGDGRMIDIGSGGGIPGIIIAICQPDRKITLLDSNGKKTRFLQHVKQQLKLQHVTVIQSRAESYSPDVLFDRIVCRAFTGLDKMVDWCGSLLSDEGKFLAMKGVYPEPDQQPLPDGWYVAHIQPLEVPFIDEQRHLITIAKQKDT